MASRAGSQRGSEVGGWGGLYSMLKGDGLRRKLSAKELMLLNCGVGEDS